MCQFKIQDILAFEIADRVSADQKKRNIRIKYQIIIISRQYQNILDTWFRLQCECGMHFFGIKNWEECIEQVQLSEQISYINIAAFDNVDDYIGIGLCDKHWDIVQELISGESCIN